MSLLRLPRAAPALRRSYATAAASVAEASGVKVAGIENGSRSGTTTVTVAVKAGARYETTPGVAHVLKNFAFKVRCCAVARGSGWPCCARGAGSERSRSDGSPNRNGQRVKRTPYGLVVYKALGTWTSSYPASFAEPAGCCRDVVAVALDVADQPVAPATSPMTSRATC